MYAKITPLQLIVRISDTGKGIPANKIDHIFNRFYRVDDSSALSGEDSGIGLALSKELAEIHKGNLSVTSNEGKGSCFGFSLPVK